MKNITSSTKNAEDFYDEDDYFEEPKPLLSWDSLYEN